VLLYPADPFLSDVVGRAAVRLGAGVITDVTDLELDGDTVVATKEIFGGDMSRSAR
jgi:electron transfer flavoprotein alpha subunit